MGAKIKDPGSGFGSRHVQSLLMFFCLSLAYALRVNMSVAIVQMSKNATDTSDDEAETFGWRKDTQSYILSSFFWGYVVTQIPSGMLTERYGAKYFLLVAMSVCSVFALLTPLAATVGGYGTVIGCRIVQGFCQGFVFPATHTMIAKWAPVSERATLTNYIYAGAQFGTVVGLIVSGFLTASSWGWPSVFYTMGAAGICWSVAWFFLGYSTPFHHTKMSDEEKKYIASESEGETGEKKKLVTPWLPMLTSLPFLSLLIVHCTHNWGFWTLLTEMPSYMNDVLKFDIKNNSLLSALPYFVMWIMSFFFGAASTYLIEKKLLSVGVSRKVFNTIAHWIPGVTLIGLAYVDQSEPAVAVTLLVIAVGVNSACYVGFQVNHVDLAPNFAGTMMGITNCFANIMSIIAPLLVGVIVPDNSHESSEWRPVFFISSAFYFVGNLLFIIFGQATYQEWNEPKSFSDTESPKHENLPNNDDTNKSKDKHQVVDGKY